MANTPISIMIRLTVTMVFFSALARGQADVALRSSRGPEILSCSPAPCVLPAVQGAAQGAHDAAITADPANPQDLILGSNYGCADHVGSGFDLSTDGGSSWNDLVCMFRVFYKGQEYDPLGGPILGYDLQGTAYIGGFYMNDSGESAFGFEGVEKSTDGIHWSAPAAAVIRKNYYPVDCWMTVDTSTASPYLNSVYVSCPVEGPLGQDSRDQMVVSHSSDGGKTWHQADVAPVQVSPAVDRYVAMAAGKDGTVYLSWEYCNTSSGCANSPAYMVFSKSSDGGNTWSQPELIAQVTLVYPLPNTLNLAVINTPAIAVDDSD